MFVELFLFVDVNSVWKVHVLSDNSLSLHVVDTSFVELLNLKIVVSVTLLFCFWVFCDNSSTKDLNRLWNWCRSLFSKSQFLHFSELRYRFLFLLLWKHCLWRRLGKHDLLLFNLRFFLILLGRSLLLLHLILNLLFFFDMNHPFSFNSFDFLSHS